MRQKGFGNEEKNRMVDGIISKHGGKTNQLSGIISNSIDNTGPLKLVDIHTIRSAPDEWNFFSKLSSQKFYELLESVYIHGVLSPGTLWENSDDETSYMNLNGHHRLECLRIIFESTNDENYKYMPALVKSKDEITEDKAREIIIDTNWASRDLTTMDKARAIYHKYVLLEGNKNKYGDGRLDDKIADEFKIGRNLVNNLKSLTNCIEEYHDHIDTGVIKISAMSIVANFEEEIQQYLHDNYLNDIKVVNMRKVKAIVDNNIDLPVSEIFEKIDSTLINTKDVSKITFSYSCNSKIAKKYSELDKSIRGQLDQEIESFINQWIQNQSN